MFLLSCQTNPKFINPDMPIVVERLFASCDGREGSAYLSIKESNKFVFGTEFDWIAGQKALWSLEAYNSFGQTIGRVDANGLKNSIKFLIPNIQADKVSLSKDGRILFNNHYVGLNLSEVPCFLSGTIPKSWRNNLLAYDSSKDKANFTVFESGRSIFVVIQDLGSIRPSFCSYLRWSEYFGMVNHELEYCFLNESPASHILTYMDGVRIKWVENPSI